MDKVDMMKRVKQVLCIALVCLLTLGLTSCATKNDVNMYGKYTKSVTAISTTQIGYFSMQISILAESLKEATTPLERHLVRQLIMDLHADVQELKRAYGTNDIILELAKKSDKLLGIGAGTMLGIKALDTLDELMATSGTIEANEGSTINYERTEEHQTTIGEENTPVYKEDPIVIEVPLEAEE